MGRQMALAQHPMYFIIKEDTTCAERTPPWGAPSTDEYALRLERNLNSLERYPDCSFGYEWSAYEIELLATEYPKVFAKMTELARLGRTAFYNGTYAQPHLQTLSSESCYRQFELGVKVYRELCDSQPTVYAHQEASVHDQVPQLLRAFGISFAVTPGFLSNINWIDGGECVVRGGVGPAFVQGSEFVDWVGLDGTTVPLYLSERNESSSDQDSVTDERILGFLAAPPLLVGVPDLIEVDDKWMAQWKDVELVLLEDALERRLREAPSMGRVRFSSDWSYIEGIQAEALSRANLDAERALLQRDAVEVIASALETEYSTAHHGAAGDGKIAEQRWKRLLACQHHDVYCFCGPEIKAKAVGWLGELSREADAESFEVATGIARDAQAPAEADEAIAVIGTVAAATQAVVETSLEEPVASLRDSGGNEVPFECHQETDGFVVRFLATCNGVGFAAYAATRGRSEPASLRSLEGPYRFESHQFNAVTEPDATISSLVERTTGRELLDVSAGGGNLVTATDSRGLSPKGAQPGRENLWTPPERGPDLRFVPNAPATIREGELCSLISVTGSIGDETAASATIKLTRGLAAIDIVWTFEFAGASIGTFFDDETKLQVEWPCSFTPQITHDIGFGATNKREQRWFTPAGWTDLSDGVVGLAYLHSGTPKHWMVNNTLHNLFGWGEHTDAIGNRCSRHNWMKVFDQRLRGSHVIRSRIIPHAGDWRVAALPSASASFLNPPLVVTSFPAGGASSDDAASHSGETTVLSSGDPDLIVTSIMPRGDTIVARLYRTTPGAVDLMSDTHNVFGCEDLFGNRGTELPAYRVAHATLRPKQRRDGG